MSDVSELQLSRAFQEATRSGGGDPYIATWGYILAGAAAAGLIVFSITWVTRWLTSSAVEAEPGEKEALLAKERKE